MLQKGGFTLGIIQLGFKLCDCCLLFLELLSKMIGLGGGLSQLLWLRLDLLIFGFQLMVFLVDLLFFIIEFVHYRWQLFVFQCDLFFQSGNLSVVRVDLLVFGVNLSVFRVNLFVFGVEFLVLLDLEVLKLPLMFSFELFL